MGKNNVNSEMNSCNTNSSGSKPFSGAQGFGL